MFGFRALPKLAIRKLLRLAVLSAALISGPAASSGGQPNLSPPLPQVGCELRVNIKDPTGRPVPQAAVSLVLNGDPQIIGTGESDASGTFVSSVEPGRYSLEVLYPGFRRYQQADVDVSCSSRGTLPSVDVRLQVPLSWGVEVRPRSRLVRQSWTTLSMFFRRVCRLV